MRSIFTVLSKYPTSSNRSPFENFSTEGLVFLLQYSKDEKTPFLKNFLNLLHCYEEDYNKIMISTQESFEAIDGYKPIPDITIKHYLNEQTYIVYFIEVKIDADLNQYCLNNKTIINQIKLYQSIKFDNSCFIDKQNIFVLSKNRINIDEIDKKQNILWAEIAFLIKKELPSSSEIENFLFSSYIQFLEDNKMAASKIEYSVEPGLSTLTSLMTNLYNIIEYNFNIRCYDYTLNTSYFGYNLIYKASGYLWVGLYAMNSKQICFEVEDPKLKEIALKERKLFIKTEFGWGEKIVSFLEMDDGFFKLDEATQYNKIMNWLNSCFQCLNII